MDKQELGKYTTLKKRVEKLEGDIEDLKLKDITVVAGKVKGSMGVHPYTERRFGVEMSVPEEAERINTAIRKREKEILELRKRMEETESFIDNIKDVKIKTIIEYKYLEGLSTEEVAKKNGYTKGRISQIITNFIGKKD